MENDITPTTHADTDWRETKYHAIFDATADQLAFRRRTDPGFTIEEATRILEHLYIADGNDWIGRGGLGDIVMAATIAAHEWFIAEWKRPGAEIPG